ncbi:hypothetical protein N1851_026770 [Merluccius polli]|uniref:Uncharacterized protein n=1 Tax=Merluccius polli TaxID=89951 RepID=A0AA47MB68_MERPO|nr:hypothetical protein N1851_026770 [Merluccius polli]
MKRAVLVTSPMFRICNYAHLLTLRRCPFEPLYKLKISSELLSALRPATEVPGNMEESEAGKLSTADLSDVPLVPTNPIAVVKNSIKLRLSSPGPIAVSHLEGQVAGVEGIKPPGVQPRPASQTPPPPAMGPPAAKRPGSPLPETPVKKLKADERPATEVPGNVEESEAGVSPNESEPPVERTSSPQLDETTAEKLAIKEDSSHKDEVKNGAQMKKLSTADLSDVPLVPTNPIAVVKNSIKLRLSR